MMKILVRILKMPFRAARILSALILHPGDEVVGFDVLRKTGRAVFPRYRFKWPQMDWWQDEPFNEYLKRFDELDGLNTDRRWMMYQLARLVDSVPGDTAECGVFQGAGSYLLCRILQTSPVPERKHFIFDSFEGISNPSANDGRHWSKGDLSADLDTVQDNLSQFENISYHKGWIPERFPDVEDRRFSFLHIDVDLYEPTRDSLTFFYPRMNDRGIILCDDYGSTLCPGATKAIDEYLADKPEKMISLSGGGGFLIKGYATARPYRI